MPVNRDTSADSARVEERENLAPTTSIGIPQLVSGLTWKHAL